MIFNTELKEWQEITLPQEWAWLGGYDSLKVRVDNSDRLVCSGMGTKVHIARRDLDTANGYHCIDGREYMFTTVKGNMPLISVRVEDCGLGAKKARAFVEALGFRIA